MTCESYPVVNVHITCHFVCVIHVCVFLDHVINPLQVKNFIVAVVKLTKGKATPANRVANAAAKAAATAAVSAAALVPDGSGAIASRLNWPVVSHKALLPS